MPRYTTVVVIKGDAHISSVFQSFSTHFIILFSRLQGGTGLIDIIFYKPAGVKYSKASISLRILSECMRNEVIRWVDTKVPTIWQFVHLHSPSLDMHVLTMYMSLNTRRKTFRQILRYQLMHYHVGNSGISISDLSNLAKFYPIGDGENLWYRGMYEGGNNSNVVTGMTIIIRGRIQTEPIKPRNTIQYIIVGSHTQPVPNSRGRGVTGCMPVDMSDRSSTTKSNYELGSYTVTVRITSNTEWD